MLYSNLTSLYHNLEATTKRLQKTKLIADFLKTVKTDDLDILIPLLQGKIFAPWDSRNLGFSSALAVKAISIAAGESEQKVKQSWKKQGDLGKVATLLVGTKKQATLFSKELTIQDIYKTLEKLPSQEGKGSTDQKIKAIAALLSSAKGEEARFILRTVLEELRIGVAEGTLRDAICWAYLNSEITLDEKTLDITITNREEYQQQIDLIQRAYDRCNDFAKVAIAAKEGEQALKQIKLQLDTPIRVMLAQRETSVSTVLERLGKPCAFEYKYDGFRLGIYKNKEQITLFTRRLENVTEQFPDVVGNIKEHIKADTVILESEAVGFNKDTGKYTAFQEISQRIRRKYNILEVAAKLPVELNIFDVLYYNGEELLDKPFEERRAILREVLPQDHEKKLKLSELLITDDESNAESFYKKSLAAGNEGLMGKSLQGKYQPGSRVGHMVKLKPTLDSMDLVIVAAEWGEGKRSGWLTSFTIACQDEEGNPVTIGKVGTGLKELEQEDGLTFNQVTQLLKPHILSESGRDVTLHPSIVLEIAFEEIQSSPSYSSGYALRFPRVIGLREDKSVEDTTTIDEVRVAFEGQRGR